MEKLLRVGTLRREGRAILVDVTEYESHRHIATVDLRRIGDTVEPGIATYQELGDVRLATIFASVRRFERTHRDRVAQLCTR